jgi:hypothetical protein
MLLLLCCHESGRAAASFIIMVTGRVGTRGKWERERAAAFIVVRYVRTRGEGEDGSVPCHHVSGSGRGRGRGQRWHSPSSHYCEVGDDEGGVGEGEGVIVDIRHSLSRPPEAVTMVKGDGDGVVVVVTSSLTRGCWA